MVISTFPNIKICKEIGCKLVKERLAACCNYFKISSNYIWQGKLAEDSEVMMFIKTTAKNYRSVESFLRRNHPYQLPEIIALPIDKGEKRYLNWIKQGVNK
ncbi:MAG: divalent-cation tolerance protein CutA [candidate division WOR-3 bacterium]